MSRLRTLIIALALAAVLPPGLAHLTGCEKSPEAPDYANPFDPAGPLGGDGLQVRATTGDNVIAVSWDHHSGKNIVLYIVDHRTDLDTEWTTLAEDIAPESDDVETVGYIHVAPDPNRTHSYLVQALTADGEFSLSGYTTPASARTPPAVIVNAPQNRLASRYLELKVVVGQGDSIRVADNPDFTGAIELPAAAPGDTATAVWDFGPRADGDTLHAYVVSFTSGSYLSETNARTMFVDFAPEFAVIGGVPSGASTKVPSTVVDLRVDAHGVEQMRFAASEVDLDAAAWVPGDTLYPGYALQPTAEVQSIWGQFQGDFGFDHADDILVRPDTLGDATFTLQLPPNRVTTHTRVGIRCDAAALSMRFADTPDFRDASWRPFAESDSVDFTGVPGPMHIYGQFRNDWTDSGILTDSLVFALLPLDIYFVTPADGAQVTGGQTLQLTGRAVAADAAQLTGVEVDRGDGNGWMAVAPIPEWTADWDVPVVTEPTAHLLRARATTAADLATTIISVTIQPAAP